MKELEKNIIHFLLTAAAYSEDAICKNLGIPLESLQESFIILQKKGYLEPYETFLKREQLNEENRCPTIKACSSCSSCSSSCSSIANQQQDYSNVLVLTEKAVEEFYHEGNN